jgi:predicted ATP-grasp superfamily ATP-dependent carboligase
LPGGGARATDLPEKLLVVSCSARMLAQSAARAGIRVVALDHYADADTRAFSAHAQAVPFTDGAFEPQALLDAACKFAPDRDFPLVYGSGLDSQPELLEALGRSREVIGNSPAIQRLFRSPRSFFELLRQCGVPYPEIRHERPENGQKWLIKSGCSEGGKRVRFCAQDQGGREITINGGYAAKLTRRFFWRIVTLQRSSASTPCGQPGFRYGLSCLQAP